LLPLQQWEHTQDNATADIFGVAAVVTRQLKDMVTLEVQQFNIICGISVPLPPKRYECTVKDVVEVGEGELEEREMKKLTSLTGAEKRFIVKACWGNGPGYAVGGEPKTMLADDDLIVCAEYLQWQYMEPLVRMLQPAEIKSALHFGRDDSAGKLAMQQIMDAMGSALYVILPVHCDVPLHWTALQLKLEKDSVKIEEVKYYDWCGKIEESARLAQKLLTLVCMAGGSAERLKLPEPCNSYRQFSDSNDCGFAVWQAQVNCMKLCRLENPCGVLPRPREWRQTLLKLLQTLVAERSKWEMEDGQGKKPKFALSIPGMKLEGTAAAHLKLQKKNFYTCGSCRWSQSGEGCCYCNPAKHDKLALEKEQRARALAEALKIALKACTDQGLIPEVQPPANPKGHIAGGGPKI